MSQPGARAGGAYVEINPELAKDFGKDLGKLLTRELGGRTLDTVGAKAGTELGDAMLRKLNALDIPTSSWDLADSGILQKTDDLGRDMQERLAGNLDKSGSVGGSRLVGSLSTEVLGGAGRVSTLFSAAGSIGVGILSAVALVGAMAGKKLLDELGAAMDREKDLDRVAASVGADPSTQARIGSLAGDLYAQAWGDSVAANAGALALIHRDMVNLAFVPDDTAKLWAAQLQDLSTTFGPEIGELTRAAGQLVRNGLASNFDEAFDLITVGFQRGADRGGEFLDTINEYSPQLAKLGLSGEDFIGSLIAAGDAGVWTIDKVGDAYKEFAIRAVDGSTLTTDALKDLGLSSWQISHDIAAGGPAAKKAFGQVVTALMGVQDATKREQLGVALFGTQWEDVGAQIIGGLLPGQNALGDFGMATEDMSTQVNDNVGTTWESIKRSLGAPMRSFFDGQVLPVIDTFSKAWQEGGWTGVAAKFEELWPIAEQKLGIFWNNAVAWVETNGPTIGAKVLEWLGKGIDGAAELGGKLTDKLGVWLPQLGEWFQNTAWPYIETHWQGWLDAFLGWAAQLGEKILPKLSDFTKKIGLWALTDGIPWLIGLGIKMEQAFTAWVYRGIESAVLWLKNEAPGKIRTAASELWDGLLDGAQAVGVRIVNWWNTLDFGIHFDQDIPGTPGIHVHVNDFIPDVAVPALASGAIVTSPTLALIGEGPEDEAVLPLSKLSSMIDGRSGGSLRPIVLDVTDADGSTRRVRTQLVGRRLTDRAREYL